MDDLRAQVIRLQEQFKSQIASSEAFRGVISNQVAELRAAVQGDLQTIKAQLSTIQQSSAGQSALTRVWERIAFAILGPTLAFFGGLILWIIEHFR